MSRGTQEHSDRTRLAAATGLSPPAARLPSRFTAPRRSTVVRPSAVPYNPDPGRLATPHRRFGLLPVRSPLLGESRTTLLPARRMLMSTPRGTEMFQFPRCPSVGLCIQPPMTTLARRRVAPFGSAWLIARLQLPRHVSPLSASFLGSWPLRHPPCTPLRLARFPSAASVCCAAILLARFGKIEVIHDMWLFKCLKLSSC